MTADHVFAARKPLLQFLFSRRNIFSISAPTKIPALNQELCISFVNSFACSFFGLGRENGE
jgi:hypothetical protein